MGKCIISEKASSVIYLAINVNSLYTASQTINNPLAGMINCLCLHIYKIYWLVAAQMEEDPIRLGFHWSVILRRSKRTVLSTKKINGHTEKEAENLHIAN